MISVGLTLPNYRATASQLNIIETAERADRLGFHSVWVADHIVISTSYGQSMGPTLYETHATLSVVAARTHHINLGCSVMPTPYRHPLFQAKSLATLDQFSGGRVIYAGATGYMEAEFQALGVDFSRRAAITDEYVRVLKLAWTEDVVTFHRRFVDCTEMMCNPKPVQQPHPPIWLGGDSDGAFRRIARLADGWHGLPGGSPGARREEPTIEHFAARIQRLHQIAEREGRERPASHSRLKPAARLGQTIPVGSMARRRRSLTASNRWRPLGVRRQGDVGAGSHRVGRLGEIQRNLAPGDRLPIPAQAVVRGGGIGVSPEPLQLGVLVQAAATCLLPQEVDCLACHLGREGVIPAAARAVGEADLVGPRPGESARIFHEQCASRVDLSRGRGVTHDGGPLVHS